MVDNTVERSEWNLASEHQKRYADLLYAKDHYAYLIDIGYYENITRMIGILKRLWNNWRSRVNASNLEAMPQAINKLKGVIEAYEKGETKMQSVIIVVHNIKTNTEQIMIDMGFNSAKELLGKYEKEEINEESPEFGLLLQTIDWLEQKLMALMKRLGLDMPSEDIEDFDEDFDEELKDDSGKPMKVYKDL